MSEDNLEERLFREILFETYQKVNPEPSVNAEFLLRKLASGLYERGARITLGASRPPKIQNIHVSVDDKDRICWTGKHWHNALGYPPHSCIGQPIERYLSEGSAAFRQEFGIPELMRTGKLGPVPATLVSATNDLIVGTLTSQILRDSQGKFLRTFSRIAIQLPNVALALDFLRRA